MLICKFAMCKKGVTSILTCIWGRSISLRLYMGAVNFTQKEKGGAVGRQLLPTLKESVPPPGPTPHPPVHTGRVLGEGGAWCWTEVTDLEPYIRPVTSPCPAYGRAWYYNSLVR